jgi:hypothetical protein
MEILSVISSKVLLNFHAKADAAVNSKDFYVPPHA